MTASLQKKKNGKQSLSCIMLHTDIISALVNFWAQLFEASLVHSWKFLVFA